MWDKKTCAGGMARRGFLWVLAAGLFAASSVAALAANLGVSPTLLEFAAGQTTAGLRVTNGDAAQAVQVQARLLRWHQEAGEDVYTPTTGVVTSPPVTRVQAGGENLIRIVRTSKTPVVGEEAYRLLVDQLPEPGAQASNAVAILIRHSVPVFFAGADTAPAQPQWHIAREVQTYPHSSSPQAGWRVTVTNAGEKRIRLVNLDLLDESGRVVGHKPGLVGYVLGGAQRQFFVPENKSLPTPPAQLRIAARDASGGIETALLPVAAL